MKKSLALVLVLAMAFALAIPAFAEEELPTAVVTPEVVVDGKDVTINLNLPAGTVPAATTYDIFFDANVLTFKSATGGNLLEPASPAFNKIAEGQYRVAISTSGMGTEDAGTLAVNKLELVDENYTGTLEFKVVFDYIYWQDATTELPITWADGTEGKECTFPYELKGPDAGNSDDPTPTEPTTEGPDGGDVTPPPTGAISMVAIAAVSAIAGMGALGLRKKEN